MALRPGYRQTEVGVIPEDWVVGVLQNFCRETITYGIVQCGPHLDDGVPYIRVSDMDTRELDVSGMLKTSPVIAASFSRSKVSKGDVVYALRGKIGEVRQVDSSVAGANLTQGTARLAPNNRINSTYLLWCLRSQRSLRQGDLAAKGSTFREITLDALRQIQIPVPLLHEQQAIATALSDTDALIEALEQLLTKKRQIKQGAMQELLTGQRRLPGFSGNWRRCLLGDVISSCSSGATPYRGNTEFYKGAVRWISSGELNYNVIFETVEHISEDAVQKSNLKLHPAGTFLIAITGLEAAGTRGACGIVGAPATTNQSCMAIYPTDELYTPYLYQFYVFRGDELALRYCQGTKQQSYTAGIVRLLPIDLPPSVEEQQHIANIFLEMAAEIATLEAKLTKARNLKQGMMQELLTGRIRLV